MGLLGSESSVLSPWTPALALRLHFLDEAARLEEMQPRDSARRLIGEGAWVSECEDRADVTKAIDGDTSAFERIVRRWQVPLVDLAYRFCYDRGLAEELAQDAFVRAFRGLRKWRAESSFSTWLHAIALNTCRSARRRLPPVEVASGRELIAGPLIDLADRFESESREKTIRRAVLTLPWIYREAVVLYYFHDQEVEMAARTIGVPQGTLKARLARARAILRQKLPAMLDEPDLTAQSI